jgi:FkbM family methyltransferase
VGRLWAAAVRTRQRFVTPQRVHALGGAWTADLAWAWKRGHQGTAFRLVDELVRPGTVALDVGANWGLFTARMARLVGPAGTVHAFEPDPANMTSLRALRRWRKNIVLHQVGLSDQRGSAELRVPLDHGLRIGPQASLTMSRDRRSMPHVSVPIVVVPLDESLPSGTAVGFVKIDVEGHEMAVLRGGEAALRRTQPTLLVEIEQRHQDTDIRQTFDYLRGLGYEGYGVYPDGIRALAQFEIERDQLRHVRRLGPVGAMPNDYINDFLFLPPDGPEARRASTFLAADTP